jgi:hypothetical protein
MRPIGLIAAVSCALLPAACAAPPTNHPHVASRSATHTVTTRPPRPGGAAGQRFLAWYNHGGIKHWAALQRAFGRIGADLRVGIPPAADAQALIRASAGALHDLSPLATRTYTIALTEASAVGLAIEANHYVAAADLFRKANRYVLAFTAALRAAEQRLT